MKTLTKTNKSSVLSRFRQSHMVSKRSGGPIEQTHQSSALSRFVENHSKPAIGHLTLIIDGTCSMDSVWKEVKAGISKLLNSIHELLPETKISILVYDEDEVRDSLKPTSSLSELQTFTSRLDTYGGNSLNTYTEALEVGLMEYARSESSFAIVIGDAAPNKCETLECAMSVIKTTNKSVYTVGVDSGHNELHVAMKDSFQKIAKATKGCYFDLESLGELIDALTAMFAIEIGKIDDLKSMWSKRRTKVSSRVAGLLTC